MNDIAQKREAIKKAYPTKSWADQVKKMPDHQVIALFLRFKSQHKI